MKDSEDRMIDLIFYCVGCNIVDILGMVGEFSLLVSITFCQGNIGVLFILLTPGLLKHKTGFHK